MSVVTVTVTSEGELMDPVHQVLSVDVYKELDRIPWAQLRLVDGDSATSEFPISDSGFFDPGSEVEILLRYEGETEDVPVFKGPVVKHGLEVDGPQSVLVVELRDAAVKLTAPRKSVVHRELGDHEVFAAIVEGAGLEVGTIAEGPVVHPELVQFRATDWDFLLGRADALGLCVVVDGGIVSVSPRGEPSTDGETHEFRYGIDEVFDFSLSVDGTRQVSAVESVGWSFADGEPTEPSTGEELELGFDALQGSALAEAVGFEPAQLVQQSGLDPGELQAWANGQVARSRMALYRGRLSVRGVATAKPLDQLSLEGMGVTFAGQAVVSGVRQRVTAEGWRTDLQFGASPEAYARRPRYEAKPAGGLLPSITGLQLGLVEAFEEDPRNELRVKVHLPALDTTGEAGPLWARLATPDAGAGRGFFFRPEPGDEVVVGFLEGDPRAPVVLGSLFGAVQSAPENVTVDESNEQRAIVSRAGTVLEFVDSDRPSVRLETPAGYALLISEDEEAIVLGDAHGNQIKLDANGIEIKSAGDLKMEAAGNVEIKGSKVDVK